MIEFFSFIILSSNAIINDQVFLIVIHVPLYKI